jgi:hypothetical protein
MSMDEAMVKVLHSKKKRKVSENKENASSRNMVAEMDTNVKLVKLDKDIHYVGATKCKSFQGSDFESDLDSDSLPAAYKP